MKRRKRGIHSLILHISATTSDQRVEYYSHPLGPNARVTGICAAGTKADKGGGGGAFGCRSWPGTGRLGWANSSSAPASRICIVLNGEGGSIRRRDDASLYFRIHHGGIWLC